MRTRPERGTTDTYMPERDDFQTSRHAMVAREYYGANTSPCAVLISVNNIETIGSP
jgi:hypothetical protein